MSEANPDKEDARHVLVAAPHNADAKKKRPAKARQKAHDLLVAHVKRPIAKYRNTPLLAIHGQAQK